MVTAIKYTITEQPQPIDNMLKLSIGQFLTLLEDEDLVNHLPSSFSTLSQLLLNPFLGSFSTLIWAASGHTALHLREVWEISIVVIYNLPKIPTSQTISRYQTRIANKSIVSRY